MMSGKRETTRAETAVILLSLFPFDLAINAAAGAAAAATGAHVSGAATTEHVLRLGAIGGLIKSAILNGATLMSIFTTNWVQAIYITIFVTSNFGLALLVTLVMSQRVLGYTEDSLLVAAIAAAAPLLGGTAFEKAFEHHSLGQCAGIGFDALAGYTFARVAQNHGFHVCGFGIAAAAGAVYGTLNWFLKLPVLFVAKELCKSLDIPFFERQRTVFEEQRGALYDW